MLYHTSYSGNQMSTWKKIVKWLGDQVWQIDPYDNLEPVINKDDLDESIDCIHKDINAAETWWQIQSVQNDILFFKGQYGKVENIDIEIQAMEECLSDRIDEIQKIKNV